MSCSSEFFTSSCVCDTLLAIVEAQDKVSSATGTECEFSCRSAIKELEECVTTLPTLDTIPVILFCKSTYKPFEGVGVRRSRNTTRPFEVVCSSIFRVVEVDPESYCAVLEILNTVEAPSSPTVNVNKHCNIDGLEQASRLERTGVCITFDLNCLCGVSCIFPQDLR